MYKYTIDKDISFLLFNDTLINIVGESNLNSYGENYFIVNEKLTKDQKTTLELGCRRIVSMEEV